MTIEDKYDGPRLHDDKKVTLEFMEKLLQHYKDRQLLHRRYAFQMLLDIRQYFMSQPTLGKYKNVTNTYRFFQLSLTEFQKSIILFLLLLFQSTLTYQRAKNSQSVATSMDNIMIS